jgi:hypothetical protein
LWSPTPNQIRKVPVDAVARRYRQRMNLPVRTAVLSLAAALSLAACGGGSSGGDTTTPTDTTVPSSAASSAPADTSASQPDDPAAAKAEITSVWEKFFHTGTARSEAVKLLEDGDNLGAALDKAEQEDKQTGLVRRAQVKRIVFTTPTHANVTWTLLNKSNPLLDNASGEAVNVDGKWLVSKLTFCTLVELGNNGKPVEGCSP